MTLGHVFPLVNRRRAPARANIWKDRRALGRKFEEQWRKHRGLPILVAGPWSPLGVPPEGPDNPIDPGAIGPATQRAAQARRPGE